jgi:hypothetical protein
MAQVDYNKNGLILIKKQSGTSVSSIDIDNCFSDNYIQYRIITDVTSSIANIAVNAQYRSGGSTTTSGYSYQYMIGSTTVIVGARATSQSSAAYIGGTKSTNLSEIAVTEIRNPFQTQYTTAITFMAQESSGSINCDVFSNSTSATTSFDGIRILPSSGNITGTIYVYGYVNS